MTPVDYMKMGSVALMRECERLEAERDALTATNNSLVDTVRELRGKVEMLQGELRDAHAHAANLAGCLDMMLAGYDDHLTKYLPPGYPADARAALAAWQQAQGGDNNADSTQD